MRFHYIASKVNGAVVEENMEADSPAQVLDYLARENLRPVSVRAIKGVQETVKSHFWGQAITVPDKIFLTRYLALMLKVGTDLFKAIDILIVDIDKPVVRAFLMEIRGSLEKGQPFYSTFAKYPNYFSSVFINLIKAGEASGTLEKIFEDLSITLQKENDLRHKIKSALTYPIILLIASFLILILLVSFALPKIAGIFTDSGMQPPLFSRIVFTIGLFIGKYVWIILGTIVIVSTVSLFVFMKTVGGRRFIYAASTKIPLLSNVFKKIALQRFASTLSTLLRAGLPILDSLEITAGAVGYQQIKEALIRIAREGVSKGTTIGDAFRREDIFPRVVVNLISISEKSGHIDAILNTLAEFYEAEIESQIKTMVTFLEPVLLLIIGFVVLIIALSIIVPIYQLIVSF